MHEPLSMMRWERHWWQKPAEHKADAGPREPSVWVDPELVVERPARMAQGTIPPPSWIGAHCTLDSEQTEEALAYLDGEITVVEGKITTA